MDDHIIRVWISFGYTNRANAASYEKSLIFLAKPFLKLVIGCRLVSQLGKLTLFFRRQLTFIKLLR